MTNAEEKKDKESREERSIPTASSLGPEGKAIGQIGPYKLLRVLGEGGFGVVYLAQQERPVKRRVALKVIKPGMDSKQVIARFEAERQALALLDHPNIAYVFNAGTTEAQRPYFVMEYVKGVSITEHCDREKLNVEERLKLFVQVCEAIGHAHQKGIIHRDIKPSNIQVSIEGKKAVPKIIDFGVAKAISQPLTERTLITEHGQLIGTPEYMSPEQAEMTNQDIDTRSDIYSLGVVLYELLAGALPFDKKTFRQAAFAEIQRIIREQDPPRPSTRLSSLGEEAESIARSRRTEVGTLAKLLHKELEWIPLKAMRKERTHRYRSASELADDIQNYLDGNPLIAGPESAAYRIKKFVRRNRTSVTAAVAVAAAIIVGLVVSTAMYFQAEQAREKEAAARAEAVAARDVAEQAEMVAQEQRQISEAERDRAVKAERLAEQAAERARKAQDLAERLAYQRIIQAAWAKIKTQDFRQVRSMLEETDPARRGWEWGYLMSLCHCPEWTLQAAHSARINGLATSRDGRFILTVGDDMKVVLWDSHTREPIWQKASKSTRRGHGVFDPNGRFVAVVLSGRIYVYDAQNGDLLYQSEPLGCFSVCIHPSTPKLYVGTMDGQLLVFDTTTWKIEQSLKLNEQAVWHLAIGTEGTRLASTAGLATGREIFVHDAQTLEVLYKLKAEGGEGVRGLAILENCGVLLKVVHIGTAVYSLDSGREIGRLKGHTRSVLAITTAPDGSRVITASMDGMVNIYDTTNWKTNLRGPIQPQGTVYHDSAVYQVAYLPEGKILTAALDGTLKQWSRIEIPKRNFAVRIPGDITYGLDYRADGQKLAVSGWYERIPLFDTASGKIEYLDVEGSDKFGSDRDRRLILFRPHSSELAVQTAGGLRFYDTAAEGYPQVRWIPIREVLHDAVFHPTGRIMAVAYVSGGVELFDVEKRQPHSVKLESKSPLGVCRLAFSHDGAMLAAFGFGNKGRADLILWDTTTGQLQLQVKIPYEDILSSGIAFHPQGHLIATGQNNGEILLWDAKSGECIKVLRGHGAGPVNSLQFSSDGRRLLSGGHDKTVRLWDWKLGKDLLTFEQRWYALVARFSPDGLSIASTGYGLRLLEQRSRGQDYFNRHDNTP